MHNANTERSSRPSPRPRIPQRSGRAWPSKGSGGSPRGKLSFGRRSPSRWRRRCSRSTSPPMGGRRRPTRSPAQPGKLPLSTDEPLPESPLDVALRFRLRAEVPDHHHRHVSPPRLGSRIGAHRPRRRPPVRQVHFDRSQEDPGRYRRGGIWESRRASRTPAPKGVWARMEEHLSDPARFEFYELPSSSGPPPLRATSHSRLRPPVEAAASSEASGLCGPFPLVALSTSVPYAVDR
jgi:hypothetical protein